MLVDYSRRNCTGAYLGVDEPDAILGILLTHAQVLEESEQLLRDTDTGRTGAHEDDAMVIQLEPASLRGEESCIDEASKDDTSGTLDITGFRVSTYVVKVPDQLGRTR